MLLGSQDDICGVKDTEQEVFLKASDQGEGTEGVSRKEFGHVGEKGVSPHFKVPP